MTAYETWVTELSHSLLADIKEREHNGFDHDCEDCRRDWAAAEQKVAIGITQARALECRQLAAELLKQGSSAALLFANALMGRSAKLEAIGMMFAQQWPPKDKPMIEVVE